MTVAELGSVVKSPIKVMSAYNGKVLCHRYKPEKHKEIDEREVYSVWTEIKLINNAYGNYAEPIICCYADGTKEIFAKFIETMEVEK